MNSQHENEKQSFGKIATTVVLDKDESLLFFKKSIERFKNYSLIW